MKKATALLVTTVLGATMSLACFGGAALAGAASNGALDPTSYAMHLGEIGPVRDGVRMGWDDPFKAQCGDMSAQGDRGPCN